MIVSMKPIKNSSKIAKSSKLNLTISTTNMINWKYKDNKIWKKRHSQRIIWKNTSNQRNKWKKKWTIWGSFRRERRSSCRMLWMKRIMSWIPWSMSLKSWERIMRIKLALWMSLKIHCKKESLKRKIKRRRSVFFKMKNSICNKSYNKKKKIK